jgi:hypothetical protein
VPGQPGPDSNRVVSCPPTGCANGPSPDPSCHFVPGLHEVARPYTCPQAARSPRRRSGAATKGGALEGERGGGLLPLRFMAMLLHPTGSVALQAVARLLDPRLRALHRPPEESTTSCLLGPTPPAEGKAGAEGEGELGRHRRVADLMTSGGSREGEASGVPCGVQRRKGEIGHRRWQGKKAKWHLAFSREMWILYDCGNLTGRKRAFLFWSCRVGPPSVLRWRPTPGHAIRAVPARAR